MDKREKHFVLIHGGCHGAWCWYKVETPLRAAGHRVTAIDMAASGIHPTAVSEVRTLAVYFGPLMDFMETLPAGERVILVGHSMGGVGISAAMEKFPEKISVAIFVACSMPGPDLDYLTISKEYGERRMESRMDNEVQFDDGPDKPPTSFVFGPEYLSSQLYNLSPTEDLTLATRLVRPFPINTGVMSFAGEFTKENYGSVARVSLSGEQDLVFTQRLAKWVIEKNPPNEAKTISGSDHMIMLSNPQELCSCLQRIAENYN